VLYEKIEDLKQEVKFYKSAAAEEGQRHAENREILERKLAEASQRIDALQNAQGE
jgi:hypothetical protein